uniref:Isoform N of Modifier of mdg4 n=2 Tax=Drosophila melanogaster TaxID=7227 RepID=Q86B87-3|nr:modifier of mdg4, isoform N [Drosophila melanogaster]AAN13875.1 modifier of mdg4, isoform N [Drosophila melanogaster]CAB85485.1 mod(mdg4)64.2 [Drosophila melanogaster]|eukprot:NP_732636.1 modifier of mdg4, isoform N [Drosophila melanogaster]
MADDEQFSLCWNNFNTNLSAGFHESLCRGDLVDVSLAAEGQIVKAHRLVLSVCSPFFRKMFTQMPSNTHAIVFLNNVSHSALKDLIQFMYCGEVNVKQDALPAFISTAESLQIKGLTDNDPAPQPPQESSPPPAAPHVQQQQIPAQRVQRQQPRASARYKIETVDDGLGDEKQSTTQIVIQTTAAPQATIVQQQQPQQAAQQIQSQQLQTGTTTTATLVSTNKRSAQRSSLTPASSSAGVKRSKTSTSANVMDPLDSTTETGATTTAQLVPQQITVQTSVVSAAEAKLHQQSPQQVRQEEAEYIDLPMELPTKSEPDYSEDHGDAAGDAEGTYVEDDTYGDMRYDDSYFTENEDAGNQTAANTSGGGVTATTSKAVVKQQSQNYSESSFVDTSGDQGNTEAQDTEISFIRSQKKNAQLVFRNYIYNKKLTQANGQTTWRCADVLKLRCKAVVITRDGHFIDARRQHNHESHASRIGQRQLYKVEQELEEYIEICTSNPKISQYLGSSNIIVTAKDGKDCKLFLPAAEATEIEMQALVDAAEEELDEEERHAEERIRDRQRVGRWRTEEAKHRSLLKSEHP